MSFVVAETHVGIKKLILEFVNEAIAELAIKAEYKVLSKIAIERANEILRAV